MLPDDPDAQARFFYLSILMIVVLASVFATYRGRFSEGLQHLMIWALIIGGLVIGYGFKDQLFSQLDPGHAVEQGGEIRLVRARDSHFYANVAVNGEEVRFMVDSGATSIVLSRRDAEELGIAPPEGAYVIPVNTANGTAYSAAARVTRMGLAGWDDFDVPVMVSGSGLGVSLLGQDWLRNFDIRITGDDMFLKPRRR